MTDLLTPRLQRNACWSRNGVTRLTDSQNHRPLIELLHQIEVPAGGCYENACLPPQRPRIGRHHPLRPAITERLGERGRILLQHDLCVHRPSTRVIVERALFSRENNGVGRQAVRRVFRGLDERPVAFVRIACRLTMGIVSLVTASRELTLSFKPNYRTSGEIHSENAHGNRRSSRIAKTG